VIPYMTSDLTSALEAWLTYMRYTKRRILYFTLGLHCRTESEYHRTSALVVLRVDKSGKTGRHSLPSLPSLRFRLASK